MTFLRKQKREKRTKKREQKRKERVAIYMQYICHTYTQRDTETQRDTQREKENTDI